MKMHKVYNITITNMTLLHCIILKGVLICFEKSRNSLKLIWMLGSDSPKISRALSYWIPRMPRLVLIISFTTRQNVFCVFVFFFFFFLLLFQRGALKMKRIKTNFLHQVKKFKFKFMHFLVNIDLKIHMQQYDQWAKQIINKQKIRKT